VNLLSVYAREVGAIPRFSLNNFRRAERKGRASFGAHRSMTAGKYEDLIFFFRLEEVRCTAIGEAT
jgi:hypothetical protein